MQGFGRLFDGVEDPRISNATRHDLHEMLMIALPCMICGEQTCTDMELFGRSKEAFLRRFMTLDHGIPSHDAFPGLFRVPGPGCLQRALVRLAADWAGRLGPDVIAIDGKTLRRSFADASKRSPLHVVSAFAAGARLALGQVRAGGKSNETAAMPALLELPGIEGMTVTADAMHTQRATAEAIMDKGGSHVLALKGNQGTLHDDVRLHMADPENAGKLLRFSDADKGHGRIEVREATVCHDVGALQDLHHWPGLRAVGAVTATREAEGKWSTETRFFLLGERLGPERFLATVRAHWTVENSLHWVLDVTMGEDGLRNRKDNGPGNLAPMRKLARLTDGRESDVDAGESDVDAGQAEEGRLGRRLPSEARQFGGRPRKDRRTRKNPNAIALSVSAVEHPVLPERLQPDVFLRRRSANSPGIAPFAIIVQAQREAGPGNPDAGMALAQMPCPRLDALDDKALDLAGARFDELSARDLLPACQSHADEARREIDSAIAEVLGLPDGAGEAVDELQSLWCREPSVHGLNKQALRLLGEEVMA